jgi:hypothetical protein
MSTLGNFSDVKVGNGESEGDNFILKILQGQKHWAFQYSMG